MTLLDYLKKIKLPNLIIKPHSSISNAFLQKNISTLWNAIEYIHKLPYGRTTNRESYSQVLAEEKGTFSVKHALIAALAEELSLPLKLILGIFLITNENTPQAATVLKRYNLIAIPEAHCYLKYSKTNLDITFPDSSDFSFNLKLEQEMNIIPQ
jgi:hypothetical protein